MTELSDFQIGQTVELDNGQQTGIVQFVGNTHFAAGDWIGVVFDEAVGKNDGSVQGQRYFDCPAGHGMFVRPSVATIIDQPTPKPSVRTKGKINGTAMKGRPSSIASTGSKRQSITDTAAAKRQSMNASSPTPAARVSRLANPSKSPTKQLGSALSSGSSTPSRTGTPSIRQSIGPPGPSKRTSMAPPPPPVAAKKSASRPSIAGSLNGSANPTNRAPLSSKGPASRLSIRPGAAERIGSASGESGTGARSGQESPAGSLEHELRSPLESEPLGQRPREEYGTALASPLVEPSGTASPTSQVSGVSQITSQKTLPPRGRSPGGLSQRPTAAIATLKKELEDKETKIRLMQKRIDEDKEKLKDLDKIRAEKDRYEGIIQKLQTKYQPLQHELADLKRQLKEAEVKVEALEAQQAENDSINEMATLDKEMAEEMADSNKLELQALRQKHEELELEVEVLREENQELGQEISPEDKTSQGWLQLERSNERYREALLRLRDVTQEQEADLREQVASLERELQDFAEMKEAATAARERLSEKDAMVEDLRQQLDIALGAEDMIEELAEKNLALNEKMEEFRATIDDLEALKELNDELEINHSENEKQLQDELDYHESLLTEEARKSAVQDGVIQDLEYTLSRFRELVGTMQSDLEDMRSSQQITEAQASELSAKSRAMIDMNMKLQTSANKTQIKAIDLELGKMETQESSEHLAIAQLFLPDAFQSERDSIQALLRFKRIGFKAKMLHGSLRDNINNPSTPVQQDDVFAYCDILNRLTWIHSTCQRFINTEQTCDLDTFKRLGAVSYELEPVERALNGWIDALKQGELNSSQCATELPGLIALMAHLSEVHISETLEHHADDVNLHATMLQSYWETTAAALLQLKSICETKISSLNTENEEEEVIAMQISSRIESLVSQIRSAKVVSSKAVRQLEELKSRCVTLDPSTMPSIQQSEQAGTDLFTMAVHLGKSILQLFAEEVQTEVITAQAISTALQAGPTTLSSFTSKLQAATSSLQSFYTLTTNLSQAVEFPMPSSYPPWKLLAQNIKAANADLVAREVEMSQLKDEMAEKNTTLAMKEKIAEEMGVKLEVLEKRVGESSGRRERVKELEETFAAAKAKERELLNKLTRLQSELQTAEAEREQWKTTAQTKSPSLQPGQPPAVGTVNEAATSSQSTTQQILTLKYEIETLQSCIRYLRTAAHTKEISDSLDFLSTPITPASTSSPSTPTALSPTQQEARAVLKEMLHLVSQPSNRNPIRLHPQPPSDRLRWRPVKDTTLWQVQRRREEWEEWREWRDGVAKRAGMARRLRERVVAASSSKNDRTFDKEEGRKPLAELQAKVQGPGKNGKANKSVVEIVDPAEWEGVVRGSVGGGVS